MNDREELERVDPEWIKEQREQGWPDVHPETFCHRCGERNMPWCANREDWTAATSAWAAETGREGICCPRCFADMFREQTGTDPTWVLTQWRGDWPLHEPPAQDGDRQAPEMPRPELEARIYQMIAGWPVQEGAGQVRRAITDILRARDLVLIQPDTPTPGERKNE